MPLAEFFEMPRELVDSMRERGPDHEDLRLLRVEWKGKEEARFTYLKTDHIRLRQRYASIYLKSAEGASPEIAEELREWAVEELNDAWTSADNMTNNADKDIVGRAELLRSEIEHQIDEIRASST